MGVLWLLQVKPCAISINLYQLIFIVGEDLAINLWDIGSGKRIKKMTGHTASIYSLSFSAESNLLVSGGADWTVRCWDVKSAGGQRGKARESGASDNGAIDDDSQETYVTPLVIHNHCSRSILIALIYCRPSQQNEHSLTMSNLHLVTYA